MSMSFAIDRATAATRERRRGRFLMRGLRSAIFGLLIACMLTGMGVAPFWINLTDSVCIAVACWFTIDLLRIPAARWAHRNDPPDSPESASHWPGWPLMLVVVAIGTVIGFTAGGYVSGLFTGRQLPGFLRGGGVWQVSSLLLAAMVPGTIITYWFYSRETIVAQEAAVQLARRQAAENQLKLLESQLEPHMLFNTLANLRVLIGIDPPRAQAMLDQLISFLRSTLSASRAERHPLAAEFARTADYLALMQVRMGARLQTRLDLPEGLAGIAVPPLLLQPLVENAIKHGLEPSVDGGRIDLTAARAGAELVLTVRDTGVGLAAASDTSGTRFGLTQVRERLAALYGDRGRLELADAADAEGGTCAVIHLPYDALQATPV
jgi:signal transduction histidine kinase